MVTRQITRWLLLACLAVPAIAQIPSFEVATIKPSDPNARRNMIGVSRLPDGIDAEYVTMSMLIRGAFGYQRFALGDQIAGLPDWTKSQHYDIHAKMSEADAATFHKLSQHERDDMINLMIQSLLAERFNLKIHHGTKVVPSLDLVVEKNGPKIKPVEPDDPHLIKDDDGKPIEGVINFRKSGEVNIQQNSMSQFATFLTTQPNGAGRPVIDKTGLTGLYTFTLHWSSVSFVGVAPDPDAPSLFTALDEDLGLKLQPSTTTLETIIVDHLDRPTEN